MQLTEEENMIIEQYKEFRENPKSFLEKKDSIKINKKRKKIWKLSYNKGREPYKILAPHAIFLVKEGNSKKFAIYWFSP